MLICTQCLEIFSEPYIRKDLLTHVDEMPYCEEVAYCPHCASEEIEEAELCPICDEWGIVDDMVDLDDTHTRIPRRFSRVCKYCLEEAGYSV